MNGNANEQGTVHSKAMGTMLGLAGTVALTGGGLLATRKAFKGLGGLIKGGSDSLAKAVKNGADGTIASAVKTAAGGNKNGLLDVLPEQNLKSSSFGETSDNVMANLDKSKYKFKEGTSGGKEVYGYTSGSGKKKLGTGSNKGSESKTKNKKRFTKNNPKNTILETNV